jgi:hypothetical protein
MMVCLELGYRLGNTRFRNDPEKSHAGAGVIEGAVLALLGLILAFDFSGASTRLVERRQLIVREANAINTAYLRVDLLPASEQPEIRQLFRRYLDARVQVNERLSDQQASDAAAQSASAIRGQIWSRAAAATNGQRSALLVLPAISEMTDVATAHTVAFQSREFLLTVLLMFVLALLSALIAGYSIAPSGQRNLLLSTIFAIAISFTVYVVLDYDNPRSGLIRLSAAEKVLSELRETFR